MNLPIESMAGIPGTISLEAAHIKWIRREDYHGPEGTDGRCYFAQVPDGYLAAIVSHDPQGKNGRKLWLISVSHRDYDNKPDRCPSWDELKHAAYRLVQADVPLVLIFPRRSTPPEHYVDIHPTTLHLWESDKEIDQ